MAEGGNLTLPTPLMMVGGGSGIAKEVGGGSGERRSGELRPPSEKGRYHKGGRGKKCVESYETASLAGENTR